VSKPQVTAPIHLTLRDGVLAAALSGDGKIVHSGIIDATKGTSIGSGTLTLLANSTMFRMNTGDGTWSADAMSGPVAFSAKSMGEAVTLSAPGVSGSIRSDASGTRWFANAAKLTFQNKARGVSASNALIKASGANSDVAGEIRISTFEAGYGLPTIT